MGIKIITLENGKVNKISQQVFKEFYEGKIENESYVMGGAMFICQYYKIKFTNLNKNLVDITIFDNDKNMLLKTENFNLNENLYRMRDQTSNEK